MSWPTVALLGIICVCLTVLVLTAGYDVDNAATALIGVVTGAGLQKATD